MQLRQVFVLAQALQELLWCLVGFHLQSSILAFEQLIFCFLRLQLVFCFIFGLLQSQVFIFELFNLLTELDELVELGLCGFLDGENLLVFLFDLLDELAILLLQRLFLLLQFAHLLFEHILGVLDLLLVRQRLLSFLYAMHVQA